MIEQLTLHQNFLPLNINYYLKEYILNNKMNSNSQAGQDIFVLKTLKEKQNGTFIEIGSCHPININNSYILENKYNWKGIMVEYDGKYLDLYKQHRPNSFHIIQDATTIDYSKAFQDENMPYNVDYLQIDLEVSNNSTLKVLQLLDSQVMDTHTFATVTFEHDIYTGDHFNTRNESRNIFERRGYVRVFSDVSNDNNAFEDWYVHPSLVDMDYVNKVKRENKIEWTDIIKLL